MERIRAKIKALVQLVALGIIVGSGMQLGLEAIDWLIPNPPITIQIESEAAPCREA